MCLFYHLPAFHLNEESGEILIFISKNCHWLLGIFFCLFFFLTKLCNKIIEQYPYFKNDRFHASFHSIQSSLVTFMVWLSPAVFFFVFSFVRIQELVFSNFKLMAANKEIKLPTFNYSTGDHGGKWNLFLVKKNKKMKTGHVKPSKSFYGSIDFNVKRKHDKRLLFIYFLGYF